MALNYLNELNCSTSDATEKVYAGAEGVKDLFRAAMGLPLSLDSSTTKEINIGRAMQIGSLFSLVDEKINLSLPLSPSGTMIVLGGTASWAVSAQQVVLLEKEKERIERRVTSLERTVEGFRPYIQTIQRLVDEHTAATVRVQTMLQLFNSKYEPTGAIEKARALDAFEEPIDRKYEEIW
jgi:hypothetical protein